MKRAWMFLPIAAWTQFAMGEGAVRTIDCKITQTCDAAGQCALVSDAVSFRMAPEALAADGSGTYQISYGDVQASMTATSYAGPFSWSTDSERNTLLASSETQFLWHRVILAGVPEAEIQFLSCTLSG